MAFRLLHLSDIHFGPYCRYLSPVPATPHLASEVAADKLMETLEEHNLNSGINAIVFSGDFSWENKGDEFETAAQFVTKISSRLGLPLTNVVLVPGNHDITWSAPIPGNPKKYQFLIRELAESGYRKFYDLVFGREPKYFLTDMKMFRDSKVVIVGLNSCRLHAKYDAGLGYVGTDQLATAMAELCEDTTYGSTREFIRIAVLHHHLLPMHDLDLADLDNPPSKRKFTLTVDARTVLDQLLLNDFSLVLHGHQHMPFCAVERRLAISRVPNPLLLPEPVDASIVVSAAGSFGVREPHATHNHFQVLDLYDDRLEIHSVETTWDKSGISTQNCHRIGVKNSPLVRRRSHALTRREDKILSQDLHAQSIVESELLSLAVARKEADVIEFLYANVDGVYGRKRLQGLDEQERRNLFDLVLAEWLSKPDRLRRFEVQRKRGFTFPDYIFRLMLAAHDASNRFSSDE